MRLKVSYENTTQILDVDTNELWGWMQLSIEEEGTLTEEERAERIQEEFDKQFNRPDYNCWHQFHRHIDPDARPKKGNGKRGKAVADDEGDNAVGNIALFGDDRVDKERDRRINEAALRDEIRKRLKPDQAELLIAVYLDEIPKQVYAAQLGITPSALSHRLETAEKNFKKLFGDPQV